MKAKCYFLIAALGCVAGPAVADSIRVGGVLHRDVYIVKRDQYYHVHFPEDGRVEKISRVRQDVEEPSIDKDEAARKAIKERFDARRAEMEGALEAAKSTTMALDTEAYLKKEALVAGAVFESQFDHWIRLSVEQQESILQEVLNLSAIKAVKREGEKVTVQSRLVALDAAREERAADLSEAERERDSDVAWEKLYTNPDAYIREHQREVVEYNAGVSDHVDESWLKRAKTEAEVEARRIAAVKQAHAGEVGAKAAALDEVERTLRQQERDAMAVENKGIDAERRYGAFLARMDELMLASRAGYIPGLTFRALETWQGDGDKRTPSVTIESPVWCLSCKRADFGISGGFAITVYDAETDTPFTRIADKDFLGMRMRIFERPGKYYFVVEQDASRIPYELTVSAVAGK